MISINKDKISAFAHLARINKPIGFYLLLWPMLLALFLAADGKPSVKNLIIFFFGMILVRSAGCAVNDIADRNFDGHVARTKYRPLATGAISVKEALLFALVLFLLAFCLVLNLNKLSIYLSIIATITTCIYPLFKRFFVAPQFILAIPFSWSIPMAYAAEQNHLGIDALLLCFANMVWIIAYDTQYAMADREDDLKIGIKSTAIWFGKYDKLIITTLQIIVLITLVIIGINHNLHWPFFLGIFIGGLGFSYQYNLIKNRDRDLCFKAFLNNHLVGLVIFVGTLFSYWLS